jgi:nitric oxide reductase NorD protein
MAALLLAERRRAADARPAGALTAREVAVERILREALEGRPGSVGSGSAWAEERVRELEQLPGPFRGLAPVPLWGVLEPPPPGFATPSQRGDGAEPSAAEQRVAALPRRPRVRTPGDDEDDAGAGTFVVKGDAAQQGAEDPMGLARPADRDTSTDPAELADALSELPEARLVRTPDRPREVLWSSQPFARAAADRAASTASGGIVYPEWDHRRARYTERGAVVRERVPAPGSSDWVHDVLARHRQLVREVRWRFERLRPERQRLDRQLDGPELDVDSFVREFADLRAGRPTDDRFYVAQRPLRRDLAVCLLLDVSASTDAWIDAHQRIIDVEKEALVVVGEAFDLLGDRAAILAFSGEGSEDVSVSALRDFGEAPGDLVRRRVAALEPDRYTRLGAAVRHATASLARQPARDRLLCLLSDGKPNDVDVYEGRYGVEDARRAVAEARVAGVHFFCLTVDRQAPAYAAHVFGPRSFAVLRDPTRLPRVLVDLLKRFTRC